MLKTVPGRKIVIGGDSCDSSELLKIGQNCDLFVHEATLSDEMKEQAEQNGHSTPSNDIVLHSTVSHLLNIVFHVLL